MRKCDNCGFENEDDAIKCSRCNYLFIEYEKKNISQEENSYTNNYNHNVTSKDDFIFQANNYKDNNGYYEIDISENNNIKENTGEENFQEENTLNINNSTNENLNNNINNNHKDFILNNTTNIKRKSPIIGLILSFIVSGLGNIYAGLYRRGVFQVILSVILNYLTFYIYPNNMFLTAINLIWAFYVMYDSYMCIDARNNGKDVPLLLGFIRFKE